MEKKEERKKKKKETLSSEVSRNFVYGLLLKAFLILIRNRSLRKLQ